MSNPPDRGDWILGSLAVLVIYVVAVFCAFAAVTAGPRPTADQLYGCTSAQQAPNGECK